MRNWKTTLAGIAAILAIIAKILAGEMDPVSDAPVAAIGLGLLAAKDYNVSGR